MRRSRLLALARGIDGARAEAWSMRLAPALGSAPDGLAIAILLATAYPALGAVLEAAPSIARDLAAEGHQTARDRAGLLARLREAALGGDDERLQRELRRVARAERVRIALREILPPSLGGADVDVTAAELSRLAEATIEVALEGALQEATARLGPPRTDDGRRARFVVLGMGKLGGSELNVGSDVDLVYLYDTDDGGAALLGGEPSSLHAFWTRVARRLTALLDEPTGDGFVWRVDLRLRPEGGSGPLVNSMAAAERYYEDFGRLWERAALARARPVAGDLAFGEEALAALAPFVWRRRVDPKIAVELIHLAERARAELSDDIARDLKHGPGGIRAAELFVQTLQLVWGGREPRLRAPGTLDALRRLRTAGFVTDREGREIADAYVALRRAEHAVQLGSGLQTHLLPAGAEDLGRLARALGFAQAPDLERDLGRRTAAVAARLASLVPEDALASLAPSRWRDAIAALERSDRSAFVDAFARALGAGADGLSADAAGELWELGRHPDLPLGGRTRESFQELAEAVLDAVADAADPEQAARYLRVLFARLGQPGVYVRLLGDDRRAVRRLVEALGASAFIGEAVVQNPELGDLVLFSRGAPGPEQAAQELRRAAEEAADEDDEAFAGALRRAKARVTIEVGLADIASEIDWRAARLTLSALADATLEAATHRAAAAGLAVIALGSLGGREIGYGSDLDVFFLYDPLAAPVGIEPGEHFARCARRVIRLISASHPAGPGYELDTRLRPSGSQGLLVTSLDAFARYHAPDATAPGVTAASWERLALLKARAVAGDAALGAAAMRIAEGAAYGAGEDAGAEIRRLRVRIEREVSQERRGRLDLKLGRGGLVEVEFAVQLLQLRHGAARPRLRTTETAAAIEALAEEGLLSGAQLETLRDGHAFLRRLEQRIRIVHADSAHLVEDSAPGLAPLARRMGIRDRRGAEAGVELLARARDVTERVRAVYEAIVGDSTDP